MVVKTDTLSSSSGSSYKLKKRSKGPPSKRLHVQAFDWLSARGLDEGLLCTIPSITKEKLQQRNHATKQKELLVVYSPKELTPAYIVVCMAKGIDFKEVDMITEFSSRPKAIKMFTAACVSDNVITVESAGKESDIGLYGSKSVEG